MKKQTEVLNDLFKEKEERTPEQIRLSVGLTKTQVYTALKDLCQRKLIIKRREIIKIGYKSPPYGTIFIKINDKVLNRIKDVINREKNK